MTSEDTTRALVGARVSVVRGAEKTSHTIQREATERYADNHGWTVVGYFEDLDVSATVSPWQRPDLGPWLTKRADEWDVIIWAKVDRAFRSSWDCADVARWAEEHHKVLVFTDDGITLDYRSSADTFASMMAKFFLTLSALFGEMELRRIRDRMKGSHKYLRNRDRWAGGKVPYGYRTAPHPTGGRTLEIDPDTSVVVKRAGDLVRQGYSLWAVAEYLTVDGTPTPTGQSGVWHSTSVSRFLRSPASMGLKVVGRKGPDGKRVATVATADDGMPIQLADPIFTDDEWDELQAALSARGITRERATNAAPLLGVVYCGRCEHRLYRKGIGGPGRQDYYACVRTAKRAACPGVRFPEDDLHSLVDAYVVEQLSGEPVTESRTIPGEDHSDELARVKRALDGVREEKDEGFYDYDGGDGEYRDRVRSLTERRKVLAALPQRATEIVEESTGEDYADAYERMEPEERRQLLLKAGLRIFLVPGEEPVCEVDVAKFYDRFPGRRDRDRRIIEEHLGKQK